MLFSACNPVFQFLCKVLLVKQNLGGTQEVQLLQGLASRTRERLKCDFWWLPVCVTRQSTVDVSLQVFWIGTCVVQ